MTWDRGEFKFDPFKEDSIYTSDSEGRRATRVIISATTSSAGGSTSGSYVGESLKVYETSTLNTVNDSVKSEDIPPPEIVTGGKTTNSATIGACTQLTATSSTLKRGVWIRHDPSTFAPNGCVMLVGIHYTSTADTIISGSSGVPIAGRFIQKTSASSGSLCEEAFIEIDDPSKIYIASNSASVAVLWSAS